LEAIVASCLKITSKTASEIPFLTVEAVHGPRVLSCALNDVRCQLFRVLLIYGEKSLSVAFRFMYKLVD
jgi:hypothetical protein